MTGQQRRSRGEGSVYWDATRQRWTATRTVGYDGRGKRIVRKGSGRTESAALRALARRVKDYEAGLVVGSEHYTVEQSVEDWLDHGQGATVEQTRRRNRDLCSTHVIPHLGGRKLRELQVTELDRWLIQLSDSLATSTLRRVRSCLSRAVQRSMRQGLVDRNVVELCEVPRGRPGRASRSLTIDQAQAVLTETQGDPLHCYIVLSMLLGARTEELRALRWEHVHLDTEPPHVEVWRSVRAGSDTKTRRSRRTLALPRLGVQALREHRAKQSEQRLRASKWADPGLVFATEVGTPMDAANVRRAFRRALKSVPGLNPEEWTPRDMRHSFVSLLSVSGVSIEDIAALVGHQGTYVTELVYRHELRPVIQTGATVMDDLFPTPRKEAE